jgi:NAD(P)-dependent dehydrogenase (short-subunit alcohol dehydrogenase family)
MGYKRQIHSTSAHAPGNSFIYGASKAAAVNVARNLAAAWRDDGIAVGAYHPGWVRTDMGGEGADISATESASGLFERFDRLSMDTTGVFESYAGVEIPF